MSVVPFPEQLDPNAVNAPEPATWLGKQLANETYVHQQPYSTLPSTFTIGQNALLQLRNSDGEDIPVPCTVVGVSFSSSTVTYDIAIKIEGLDLYTILYNIDSSSLSVV